MYKILLVITLALLASCSSTKYIISLDRELSDVEGFHKFTPIVEFDDYSNTFESAVSKQLSITAAEGEKELKFRLFEPLPEKAKGKIIILMPGNQNPWLSMMPIGNELLNAGYHITFIDYYGEPNGLRADEKRDWGEKEISEVSILISSIKSVEQFKDSEIGYFGTSLGSLVGLKAMVENKDLDCFIAEGMPVNPRKSAEQMLDKSFWAGLFVDLNDYSELLEKYNIENNLQEIDKSKSLFFFWGDDDVYYFEDDWKEININIDGKFNNYKNTTFDNAKHANRLGKNISKEKFDEINKSIVEYFNNNL